MVEWLPFALLQGDNVSSYGGNSEETRRKRQYDALSDIQSTSLVRLLQI